MLCYCNNNSIRKRHSPTHKIKESRDVGSCSVETTSALSLSVSNLIDPSHIWN